jgi:hypothetical protein
MNRRGFFTRLGVLVGAASLSPTIFVPKFEAVRWKVVRSEVVEEIWGGHVCWTIFSARELAGEWRWVSETESGLKVLYESDFYRGGLKG